MLHIKNPLFFGTADEYRASSIGMTFLNSTEEGGESDE